MAHPFRFAITATSASDGAAWATKARRIEELGYDVLLITDHMSAQLAPLVALAHAAAATTRLRLGTFVLANDYRDPVLLAKEAASLDVLSGGRFELGLGAGWSVPDYRMLGLRYDAPRVRVDRFEEALGLIRRCLTEDRVDHLGAHYRVAGARVLPRAVQRPHPPLMVGGGGRRVLRIAAREAQIVAFAPQTDARGRPRLGSFSERALAERVALVRRAAGDRFASLELNVIVFDVALSGPRALLGGALRALVRTPYVLYGSYASVRRELLERRERLGISYYALPDRAMEEFAPLARELRAL